MQLIYNFLKKYSILYVVFLVGCATASGVIVTGKNFDTSNIEKVQKGKTTKQEVLQMFGTPPTKKVEGSSETWTYSYSKIFSKATAGYFSTVQSEGQIFSKNLSIKFDSLNVAELVDYTISGDSTFSKQK